MARTITLQNLIKDVRYVGDHEGATLRHTDEKITRALNQSIQAFRLMISNKRHDYYSVLGTVTMTAGDSVASVTQTDVVRVCGLDIQVNGVWIELEEFDLSRRNEYESTYASTGEPRLYRHVGGTTGGVIYLLPKPDAVYTTRLWYLPVGTDLTGTFNADGSLSASSSTFDGRAGWEDWVVYDTCLRLATRDGGANDNFELLQSELARIQDRIVRAIGPVRDQPARRLDTRGRREAITSGYRFRW